MAQRGAGLLESAEASFSQALKLSPQLTPASSALAGVEVAIGDQNAALQMAERTLAARPGSISGHIAKARALIAKGDIAHGETELQSALTSDPVSLPALAILLKLAAARGKSQEVTQRVSRLLGQYPQNAGLYFLRALGYFSLRNLDAAEADVQKALSLAPTTPDAYTLLANIDLARGHTEKAEADLRHAITAQPRTVANYVALGVQFEKQNRWDEAKKLFEKAHEIAPASPTLAAELAFLYLEHGGDVNLAVSLAQMARQKLPDSPMTSDALGWAYFKLGSSDLAIAQLKESTAKVPDNPLYQYHLGMAYLGARKPEMAAQLLRLALQHDPNFPNAASARATLDKITHNKFTQN
jgi:tetratricopeptide (TPR) repeat protein